MYWYSCSGSGLMSNGSGIAGGSGTVGHFKEARHMSFLCGAISYPSWSPLRSSGTVGISMTIVRLISNATIILGAMHLSLFRPCRAQCHVGHSSPWLHLEAPHAHDELKKHSCQTCCQPLIEKSTPNLYVPCNRGWNS